MYLFWDFCNFVMVFRKWCTWPHSWPLIDQGLFLKEYQYWEKYSYDQFSTDMYHSTKILKSKVWYCIWRCKTTSPKVVFSSYSLSHLTKILFSYCENYYSKDRTKTLRINIDKALNQLQTGVDAAIVSSRWRTKGCYQMLSDLWGDFGQVCWGVRTSLQPGMMKRFS